MQNFKAIRTKSAGQLFGALALATAAIGVPEGNCFAADTTGPNVVWRAMPHLAKPPGVTSVPAEARSPILAALRRDSALPTSKIAQRAKLTSSDGGSGDEFGLALAISGDTIVVGAYGNNSGAGAAYVLKKPQSGWRNATQTAKLSASDGASKALFGNWVAISGSAIVVGAPWADVGSNLKQGAAYVFVKPKSGWVDMTQTAKLTAADGQQFDQLGDSVAINGNTIVAGQPAESEGCTDNEPGAAYVFVKAARGWKNMTQTGKLTASDGQNGDQVGWAVAINSNTIVVGSVQYCTSGPGEVYVYSEPKGGWMNSSETAQLKASKGATGDLLGYAVSIGTGTIVAGAPSASLHTQTGQGKSLIFVEPQTGWVSGNETARLSASDGASGDYFGASVAIDPTDADILIGAPQAGCTLCFLDGNKAPASTGPGSAYLFKKPGGGWASTTKFDAKYISLDGAIGDGFGYFVAFSGTTDVFGAPFATIDGNPQGAAYVFAK